MRGTAVNWDGGHPVGLTNHQVMRWWPFTPCWIEIVIRRLKLYQSWAKDPLEHSQVRAALLGELE
eukprot:6808993-Pyramimonas_sp.AAC.1